MRISPDFAMFLQANISFSGRKNLRMLAARQIATPGFILFAIPRRSLSYSLMRRERA
jgi:hypothetical protein